MFFADDTAEFIQPKSQPLIRSVMAQSELLFSGALIYSIRSVGSSLPDGHERDLWIVNTAQSLASSGILFEDFGKTGATGCVQRHQHVSICSYVNSGVHTLPSTLPCACVCVYFWYLHMTVCLKVMRPPSQAWDKIQRQNPPTSIVFKKSILSIFADVSGCMFWNSKISDSPQIINIQGWIFPH